MSVNHRQQKTHLCKRVSENNDLQDNQQVRLVVRSGDYGAMPTAAATLSPLGICYLAIAFGEVYNGFPITGLLE